MLQVILTVSLLLSSAIAFAQGNAPKNKSQKTFTIGLLGDSISTGFDSEKFLDNRNLSWATGLDERIQSHATRLKKILEPSGIQVEVRNAAGAGARSNKLDTQWAWLESSNPDYLAVFIGANDICKPYDLAGKSISYDDIQADYLKNIRDLIANVRQKNKLTRILFLGIPDVVRVARLYEKHKNDPLVSWVKTCPTKWRLGGLVNYRLCKPALYEGNNEESRTEFENARLSTNKEVAKLVEDLNDPYIKFDNSTAVEKFEIEFISELDCFHPSIKGQKILSEKTFDEKFALKDFL